MAYQIPQQLEYKEKIMFGLTFKQLAYAFVFGAIAFINFRILSGYTGFILALFWVCLGIGFIFFDFESKLKDYWHYFKSRKLTLTDKTISSFFGVKEIKDSLIFTSKDKKIAILKVTPINFSIKTPEEKEAIMIAFQKFLNSLDFPTQIIMNTESLELNEYLDSLKSRTDKKFEEIFVDYQKFLQETISSKKIMNRVFYLVIPEQNNIDLQVSVCIDRFGALNLRVERLRTIELERLINQFLFNTPKNITISNNVTFLETNKKFYRIIYAFGYPRTVDPGFLDRIVSLHGDFNLSMHLKPYPIENMLIDLNKELQKQRADLYAMQLKGIINPSLEIQYKDTRRTLESLQKGKERLFNIGLYITCKADSLDDLDILTKKVEAELNSIMILPKIAKFRMVKGLNSTIPLGVDDLKTQRNITTSALSAFFPFTSQFLQADNTGVWLGLNKNNIPIIKDIFKLPNPNGVVLAQSGGGKSYFCKLLITRYLLNGTKVIIIDPQGEYKGIVARFGGQIIDLSRSSKTLINPMDLMGHDYTEKRLSLMDLMPVMLGDISEPQKAFLDKAITNAYLKKGINADEESWENKPPTMKDILDALYKLERSATQIEKATLRSIINRVEMYVTGVFSFLDRHTNIGFNNRIVCFDIGNMPKQVKPVIMFLVLDYVYMKMRSDIERKILLIDEAWSLLSRNEDAGYILEIVKTCRKFNMGLLLINQEVEDLFNSRAGKSVLANSAYTMLLRQKPSVINKICETFHLSPSEREHLLTANVGEGLLIMEDEHSKIKVVASPEEHGIITTNPDEILSQKKITSPKSDLNVDLTRRFYRAKELNDKEREFLIKQGYKEVIQQSLIANKKEKFLLKSRHNESLPHMFFVYSIAEYLEKRGIYVDMFTTKMPDLVFEINGKRFAIEVETGSVAENLNRLKEKVDLINTQKYDDWFFVVTDKHIVKKYRKFGKVLDPRYLRNQINKIVKNSKK